MSAITLDEFTVDREIGRGGMAEVWLGTHRRLGLPAAIKVITRRRADDARYREGFRREVRAVAGLDHPGIVSVLDAGVVDAAAAAAAKGALTEGSPWLAMALAEQGDLRRLPQPMAWPLLRDVLLQVLDALAHAHARGVVHRDLKPENVLLRVEHDRLRLMLTDFGIAYVAADERAGGGGDSMGTPQYMAPEQIRGEWRDYGPWTDLYALGCMAFELAMGRPPYLGKSPVAIATAHLTGEIPVIAPPQPLPAGLAEWIHRLMQRAPRARFQQAADAARALAALPAPSPDASRRARLAALDALGVAGESPPTLLGGPGGLADGETHGLSDALRLRATLATVLSPGVTPTGVEIDALTDARASARPVDPRPAIPPTWYLDAPERPILRGLGLGLFGVRAVPFVERDAERDTLWAALRAVEETGRGRLVLIEGAEGSGKTRLAEWFGHRAAELGVAEVITMRHSAMEAPGDGAAAAIEHWFRGAGLDREALTARIADLLGALYDDCTTPGVLDGIVEADAPALARWLRPEHDPRCRRVSMSPSERYGAAARLIEGLARRRAVVLHVDDVQWTHDGLVFVQWLLARSRRLPVLIVATVRPDLLADRPLEAAAIEALRRVPYTATIELGPLPPADHARFVRELLGLDPVLTRELLDRTAGNPLFALQIIADWVERDALRPGARGYTCSGFALTDIPSDLATLARRRLDRLAARFAEPSAIMLALEVAAALGHAVHPDEWTAAARALEIDVPHGLGCVLHDAGFARSADDGWMWAHGFVRDALLATAREEGRLDAIHRACAAVVHRGRVVDERRARHLLAAGAHDAALDALATAAVRRLDASEYLGALALCDRRIALLDEVGAPADDIRRAQTLPVRFDALRFTGRIADAHAVVAELDGFHLGAVHPGLLADLARAKGGLAFTEGRTAEIERHYTEAIELYIAAGDHRGEARARHGLGWGQIYHGDYPVAARCFDRARARATEAGLVTEVGWALHGLAGAELFGETGRALDPLGRARDAFARSGSRTGLGSVRLFLAEAVRQKGDLDAAIGHIEATVEMLGQLGAQLAYVARFNQGGYLIDAGRLDAAAGVLDALAAEAAFERVQKHYHGSGLVFLAWLDRLRGRTEALDRHVERLAAFSTPFMHPLSRRYLDRLAAGLEDDGRSVQAAQMWRAAAFFWAPADRARAAQATARAEALGGEAAR